MPVYVLQVVSTLKLPLELEFANGAATAGQMMSWLRAVARASQRVARFVMVSNEFSISRR